MAALRAEIDRQGHTNIGVHVYCIRPAKDRGCMVSYDGAFLLECSSWLDLTCVIPNSNVSGARL
jgi:hypothetical protein